jgi:hypothetical protein
MSTAPIPVLPGRRGSRGVRFARTRRLRELRDYYRAKATDPTVDEGFRRYCAELVDEVTDELRRRNSATTARAA